MSHNKHYATLTPVFLFVKYERKVDKMAQRPRHTQLLITALLNFLGASILFFGVGIQPHVEAGTRTVILVCSALIFLMGAVNLFRSTKAK